MSIPAGTKFIGIAPDVDTVEKKSTQANSPSNVYTIEDIQDGSVPDTRTITINGDTKDLSADRSWTISTGITVGTTPVTSGTNGRVFFQAGGVVQQDANFTFDNTLKRLTLRAVGTGATDIPLVVRNSADTLNFLEIRGDNQFLFNNNSSGISSPFTIRSTDNNSAPYIRAISNGDISEASLIATRTGGSGVSATGLNRGFVQLSNVGGNLNVLSSNEGFAFSSQPVSAYNPTSDQMRLRNGNLSIGTGYTGTARLDVRAQGALSTDIAFRVRNSADTQDLFSIRGNKDIYLPSTGGGTNVVRIYANADDSFGPNTLLTYGRKGSGNIAINESATFAVGGFQQTAIGISAAVSADGGISLGDTATVDSGATNGIAIGKFSRGFGLNFIAIGTGPAINQTYGGNNTIVLGNRTGGFGININNVFFTYFASNNVTTITKDNGSFGLLGQQVEVRDSTQLTNNMGNGGNTLVVRNHTSVPSTNITDSFQQYSADVVAGNAAPHFRTENGAIVKVYQETTAVAASTLVGNAGANITDTDTFDGYTLKQIVKALRNQGLLA